MDETAITAIVLAAGLSKRMGRFKPLLPLGACSTIERVVKMFQDAGVADILVVTGNRGAEVRQAAASLRVRCVENPDFIQGMFTSVLAGVRALPGRGTAFFVHPVDIPLVRPQTVRRVVTAFEHNPAAIVYPAFDGRRGHPTLIQTRLGPGILEWSGSGGLRAFLQRHEEDCLEVPVADEGVLLDLDTPEDYHRMQARLSHEGLPSPEECRVLTETIQCVPASIVAHSRAVAAVAYRLAQALNRVGVRVDGELVRTAALLHDIARSRKRDHAEAGARLLEAHGFTRLAPIVGAHMDIETSAHQPVDEAQVVYLADKLVLGDQRVELAQRFAAPMRKYGADPAAAAAIEKRRENARCILAKVERLTGLDLDSILESSGTAGGQLP
jgi:molybdenum cofactor cytidylyltransferase